MKRVGIMRGGENYETSVFEGGHFISYILENLSERWKPIDILVDQSGVWHADGVPVLPGDLMSRVDVVVNLADPHLRQILQNFSIRSLGTPVLPSFSGSRDILKEQMKKVGLNLPRHIILPAYREDLDGAQDTYTAAKAQEIFEKFSGPWLVKPLSSTDMAVHVAKTFPELAEAIWDGIMHGGGILVEELIPGKVAEVHSLSNFRGEETYTLPVAGLSKAEKEKIIKAAKNLHEEFRSTPYLNSYFILHPRGSIYITDLKFVPSLWSGSTLHQAAESVGSKTQELLNHLLEQV